MSATPAAIRKANEKLPVRSTTTPVITGAEIPARLVKKFCTPIQRAAAPGPASGCALAQMAGTSIHRQTPHPAIAGRAPRGPARTHTPRHAARPENPASSAVLRTRLALAPALSQRSEAEPVRTEVTADSA